MKIDWGISDYFLSRQNKEVPVVWDSDRLINPHILICGKSGTGKTHRLRKMVNALSRQGVRFHIFDVHADIRIPGESRVVFSESSRCGYNPLVLNPDPHSGGVRRTINGLIATLNRTSSKLGDRQAAVLRALLTDIYFLSQIYEDNPRSWVKKEIDEATRKQLMDARRYNELKDYYPTVEDLISFAERKLKALYLGPESNGVGSKCLAAVEETNRGVSQLKRLTGRIQRSREDEEIKRLETQIANAKERAITSFSEYVMSIESGRELEEMIKYDSRETLKSVVDRLKNLSSIGIFRPNPPPFDPDANVWVYDIKSLPKDEQLLFVYFRMEDIFRRRVQAGAVDDVKEIIIVDEANNYFTDEPDNVFNVISKEARKFGLGLWCASQSPTHFSEDFLTTVATKVLLGIDSYFWKMSATKLRCDESVLKFITPQKTCAVYMDRKGEINAKFLGVRLPEELPQRATVT
jgi:hypothetical protein